MVMNLYGRSKPGTSTSSPHRTGLGSAARRTPPSTGKKSSSKSESDAVDVSSSATLSSLNDKHRKKSSCSVISLLVVGKLIAQNVANSGM